MVEAVLYVLTGTLLYAGAHHLYRGTTRAFAQPHAQLAAMYLLLAGFVLIGALMVQPQEFNAQVRLARLSMTLGILLWIVLIWYIALYTQSKPLLLLDLLTAVWIIFLIRNLSAPQGLLYADILPIEQTTLPGQDLSALYVSVNSWWLALKSTMLASLLFCCYASLQMFRWRDKPAALMLISGLSVLVAALVAEHLFNTRVVHALYFASFGFIGFLLANSLYLIVLDDRRKRKAIQAPATYSLTFDPMRALFNGGLSHLQPPAGEEAEVAVAPVPESAAATNSDTPLSSNFSPVDGESLRQNPPTPMPKRDQPALNTVSDNLIDIAVYATMALNRFKRGDADPQVLQSLCRKIRSKAIRTRRMANKLSRPGNPD